jgi:hypothetical protein
MWVVSAAVEAGRVKSPAKIRQGRISRSKLVDHARERAWSPSAQPVHPTTTTLAAASLL